MAHHQVMCKHQVHQTTYSYHRRHPRCRSHPKIKQNCDLVAYTKHTKDSSDVRVPGAADTGLVEDGIMVEIARKMLKHEECMTVEKEVL